MDDTEVLLARTRMRLRRQSPDWRHPTGLQPVARRGGEGGGLEATIWARNQLAAARWAHDVGTLPPGNRLVRLKRWILRAARFYTDRQVQFNTGVVSVLEEEMARLDRVSRVCLELARDRDARLSDLARRIDELEGRSVGMESPRESSPAGDSTR